MACIGDALGVFLMSADVDSDSSDVAASALVLVVMLLLMMKDVSDAC